MLSQRLMLKKKKNKLNIRKEEDHKCQVLPPKSSNYHYKRDMNSDAYSRNSNPYQQITFDTKNHNTHHPNQPKFTQFSGPIQPEKSLNASNSSFQFKNNKYAGVNFLNQHLNLHRKSILQQNGSGVVMNHNRIVSHHSPILNNKFHKFNKLGKFEAKCNFMSPQRDYKKVSKLLTAVQTPIKHNEPPEYK